MTARWQKILQRSIRTHEECEKYFGSSFAKTNYPLLIPLSLAEKIKHQGLDSPLAHQFLPQSAENLTQGLIDPIGDHQYSPAPQIVHRYQSRALLFPTTTCPVICRYCFRKNELYQPDSLFLPKENETLDYLLAHPEIEELILSGGDPLMLNDKKLEQLLSKISKIKHIRFLRFHTRFISIIPERINNRFLGVLNRYQKFFSRMIIVIHSNHISEWGPASLKKIARLNKIGIELRLQSVLLPNVNDTTEALLNLYRLMIHHRVTPYYLHHPDHAKGTSHFQLSIEEGRKIFAPLRAQLPGWALPRYTVDIPGGHGKVDAFNPESYSFAGKLLNQHGEFVEYSS
jgi:lysine 2,3-aminomutase